LNRLTGTHPFKSINGSKIREVVFGLRRKPGTTKLFFFGAQFFYTVVINVGKKLLPNKRRHFLQ
jgi:hypothetical protein